MSAILYILRHNVNLYPGNSQLLKSSYSDCTTLIFEYFNCIKVPTKI